MSEFPIHMRRILLFTTNMFLGILLRESKEWTEERLMKNGTLILNLG
jgi:hypothetical protein